MKVYTQQSLFRDDSLTGQSHFEEPNLSTEGGYTIAELFERYFAGYSITDMGDGIDNTSGDVMNYDSDLLDMPTRYEDGYRDFNQELTDVMNQPTIPPKSSEASTEPHELKANPAGQGEV